MDNDLKAIAQILEQGESFLVAGHIHPDGDAIGATLAMGHILHALNKDFILYSSSGLPKHLDWLDSPWSITTQLPEQLPQWVIALDCGEVERLDPELQAVLDLEKTINIDHHLGNTNFGKLNWVDPRQAAVGGMIAQLAKHFSLPLSAHLAEAIYLAIFTDTGSFAYANTSPESLELVAELMRQGLDIANINLKIQKIWTHNRIQLWQTAFSSLQTYHDKQLAMIAVSQKILKQHQATKNDCEGIVEFLRRLKTVRVAIFLREEIDGAWKFSLRSSGEDNIQKVAQYFGGGGHKHAAAGIIHDSFENAWKQLLSVITQKLTV